MERVCPKCAEKDKEIDVLNKKIVELQFFIDDLKESQETDKKKISEVCKQLEKEKDRYNQLQEEKGSNEANLKKINELSKQLEAEKGSNSTYIKKISELSKQLEEEKDKYNKLKKEYDSYKASNVNNTQYDKRMEVHKNILNNHYMYLNNNVNNQDEVSDKRFFPIPNYEGYSIVDALKSIGHDSSFNYRKRIAAKNGIGNGNYTGQPNENLNMLELLCKGRLLIP